MPINTINILAGEAENMTGQIKIYSDICNFYLCMYGFKLTSQKQPLSQKAIEISNVSRR